MTDLIFHMESYIIGSFSVTFQSLYLLIVQRSSEHKTSLYAFYINSLLSLSMIFFLMVLFPDELSTVQSFEAPDDIQLSCQTKYNNVEIENGLLAQFNNDKKLWQLLFAPERTGPHELIVYAKRTKDGESSKSDAKFNLDVTKLRRPMKFHMIYTQFRTKKCQIYTPMDGILKKGSVVPIHCVISGAKDVNLTIDSNWIKNEGYRDPVL
ncbi:unnamed protein product [Rotaria socialis]|uniref:KY-like immunoglobulin-like domain-containing protein n=4 Tax=Rotaria socialis TaxID=392032 RepID=A0A818CI12_9BILA|nr:unnamed protein product [Rotaria socialis]